MGRFRVRAMVWVKVNVKTKNQKPKSKSYTTGNHLERSKYKSNDWREDHAENDAA